MQRCSPQKVAVYWSPAAPGGAGRGGGSWRWHRLLTCWFGMQTGGVPGWVAGQF